MALMKMESECALKVTDELHVHLPSSAFTNEASNFWFGIIVGVGIVFAFLASMADK